MLLSPIRDVGARRLARGAGMPAPTAPPAAPDSRCLNKSHGDRQYQSRHGRDPSYLRPDDRGGNRTPPRKGLPRFPRIPANAGRGARTSKCFARPKSSSARRSRFGKLMTTEMGKPIQAARDEAAKCAWACRYYAENAERLLADERVETDAAQSFVRYQPLGPVLAIMPWNFPFWQVFRFAAPALMAGNVGLLKHASNVPQCALAIEEIFRHAGFPDGVFQTLLIGAAQVPRVHRATRASTPSTLTGSEPRRQRRSPPRPAGRSRRPCSNSAAATRSSSCRAPTSTPRSQTAVAGPHRQQRPVLHRRQALHRRRSHRRRVRATLRRSAWQR